MLVVYKVLIAFIGFLPFGSERCAPSGPADLAGFSLFLLCSKLDFACVYKVLLAFIGFLPFGSERCALPAGPAGLAGFSLFLLCSKLDVACFYKVLLAFIGFLPFGSERLRARRPRRSRWFFPGFTVF